MKAILTIFNPRNWGRAGLLRYTRAAFSSVGRRAATAWRGAKAFALRNKQWLGGVAGGVAAGLIVRGLSKLWAKAEQTETEQKRGVYARMDPAAAVAMKRKTHCAEMISAIEHLMYSNEYDNDRTHSALSSLICHYHCLLQSWTADETVDFAITADRVLGGAARTGVTLEDAPHHAFVVSRMRVLKDDENPEVLDSDLINLVYLDSTNLPLKML